MLRPNGAVYRAKRGIAAMRIACFIAAAALGASSSAWAQDVEPLPSPEEVDSGNGFTIGLGAAMTTE
jgi:hypothetical protein